MDAYNMGDRMFGITIRGGGGAILPGASQTTIHRKDEKK
jgi:hypothetical protein